ncbi:MAG: peptidoglycan DD-metalloendopeptidase family protein [Betaproteobacteria bacterium]|nr:peptidoglycan DD-metalloendopeptidase family protein [Betaproteobacteria bacterium]
MASMGAGLILAWLLTGCASQSPAPVSERAVPKQVETTTFSSSPSSTMAPSSANVVTAGTVPAGYYIVKKGDTLYSIALEHGQSYRDLAAWNSLENPNKIQVGQQLRIQQAEADAAAAPVAVVKPIAAPAAVETRPLGSAAATADSEILKREPKGGKLPYSEEALAKLQKADSATVIELKPEAKSVPAEKPAEKTVPVAPDEIAEWAWPAAGKVIGNFVEGSSKGLDIAGKTGEPVQAAAAGKVILVSSALRGYGNFVIIKHSSAYLSVYAHNSRILVKEEQVVSKGQKIAEIGSSDSDQPKLHFEIRHQGKPVDPLKFLSAR